MITPTRHFCQIKFMETNTPGVFAAGDIVSGPRTVVDAVAFTKKVFRRMEEYLGMATDGDSPAVPSQGDPSV